MHAHNLFPLFSPAVLRVAKAEGVPVVQTMHNYRLSCINAIFFRSGKPCEACQGHAIPWPGLLHRCYRQSALLSGGVAGMIATHRLLRTWSHHVDLMIALTDFARGKLVGSGIPAAKIEVKPNFLATDPGAGPPARERYALFVGRVTPEKGVATLIRSWAHVPSPLRLKIVGDGPFAAEAAKLAAADPRIEFLGRRTSRETLELMRHALAVVVPSEWYETFGRVVIEAFATGTPVVAARIGAIAELVQENRTGRLFEPGNPEDLARSLLQVVENASLHRSMQAAARAEYAERYTAEINYAAMRRIYDRARLVAAAPPRTERHAAPVDQR
jgi:glycosyltransferase involved in cell wall biosynthesis